MLEEVEENSLEDEVSTSKLREVKRPENVKKDELYMMMLKNAPPNNKKKATDNS